MYNASGAGLHMVLGSWPGSVFGPPGFVWRCPGPGFGFGEIFGSPHLIPYILGFAVSLFQLFIIAGNSYDLCNIFAKIYSDVKCIVKEYRKRVSFSDSIETLLSSA